MEQWLRALKDPTRFALAHVVLCGLINPDPDTKWGFEEDYAGLKIAFGEKGTATYDSSQMELLWTRWDKWFETHNVRHVLLRSE